MADQYRDGRAWIAGPLRVAAGSLRVLGRRRRQSLATPAGTPHPIAWRHTLQSRLTAVAGLFAVWTIGIEARLLYLQVVEHTELKALADRQQLDTIDVPAKRGEILEIASIFDAIGK